MSKTKVRSPFTGVAGPPGHSGTMNNPVNGEGFPNEIVYRGDGDFPVQCPFTDIPAKPGVGRSVIRSPFENPKIGSKAKRTG